MTQARIDLEHSIGYALKQASVALRNEMDAALRPLALSVPQYSCLELLGHRPGISASELARGVFVTRQSMHSVLTGLQQRGLLERATAAAEGRALPTVLTDDGRRLLEQASSRVAAVEDRMLQAMDRAQQHRLYSDLAACVASLSESGQRDATRPP